MRLSLFALLCVFGLLAVAGLFGWHKPENGSFPAAIAIAGAAFVALASVCHGDSKPPRLPPAESNEDYPRIFGGD